jgi:hypothetical protein
MRDTGLTGAASPVIAFIDDEMVCRLNNKCYSTHEVEPGTHSFCVQFMSTKLKPSTEKIEITTEPGKTYYIQTILKTGVFMAAVNCQEVTESTANKELADLQVDKDCR